MTSPQSSSQAYEINGQPADARTFTRAACDPARSVVVEACAGSGKTWLLVARALRLLLAGAQPAELLAITFTRKAAQEMQARLMAMLKELALSPPDKVRALLEERGVREDESGEMAPFAQRLYERVLASPHPVSFDTFHGWFSRLLRISPLGAGVPHGYTLTETTGDLRDEAYRRFMRGLNDPEYESARKALALLYESIGDNRTHGLLDCFVEKRAEWWAACQRGAPIEWLEEICGEDGRRDARLTLWNDEKLLARVRKVVVVLGKGSKDNQARATRVESALSIGASSDAFVLLLNEFCDDKGKCKGNYYNRKELIKSAEENFGVSIDAFRAEFEEVSAALYELERRSAELKVLELNRHLFTVGQAYLDVYQTLKDERRVLDFTDLEWHAYRLMNDADHAAYLQARLDARYRHILLDEFQDTNPLQWCVVRGWLEAYGGDGERPTLFVVGDPKQSIYRFRRADPRVFDAARELLRAQGAAILRTNRTRRNATAIVEALNGAMEGNARYVPQSTLSEKAGVVWRLPLVEVEKTERKKELVFPLRDSLTIAREEDEDERRLHEGRAVAQSLLAAYRELSVNGEPLRWKDVMLLVKKRTRLTAYEAALREANIPFVSDRRGGLLDSLEALDLIALLNFLVTPCNDLALAHVLKSPIGSASDEDLIALAETRGSTWHERLNELARKGGYTALARVASLLEDWIDCAARLPVHDLLDRIMHEGELRAKYAQAAPAAARAQVLGNLDAFIELALGLDGGRYPSLQKFIDEIGSLRKMENGDSPDEADIDAATDAVRILTVHGAKGLEARVVALLDANHSEAARDDAGILCDWPEHEIAPVHFSAFGARAERGRARDGIFEAEERLKNQEDWNLLYVAATRARECLIVSGVASGRAGSVDGLSQGSWYARLLAAPEYRPETGAAAAGISGGDEFSVSLFSPPRLPPEQETEAVFFSTEIDEGILLHALMERVTQDGAWPAAVPETDVISRWFRCPEVAAAIVRGYAAAILSQPQLERFFHRKLHAKAHNELEIMANGETVRIDRLVLFDDEIWILDYKRRLLDSERDAYERQLKRYRDAVRAVFPKHAIMSALIAADGGFLEMT